MLLNRFEGGWWSDEVDLEFETHFQDKPEKIPVTAIVHHGPFLVGLVPATVDIVVPVPPLVTKWLPQLQAGIPVATVHSRIGWNGEVCSTLSIAGCLSPLADHEGSMLLVAGGAANSWRDVAASCWTWRLPPSA